MRIRLCSWPLLLCAARGCLCVRRLQRSWSILARMGARASENVREHNSVSHNWRNPCPGISNVYLGWDRTRCRIRDPALWLWTVRRHCKHRPVFVSPWLCSLPMFAPALIMISLHLVTHDVVGLPELFKLATLMATTSHHQAASHSSYLFKANPAKSLPALKTAWMAACRQHIFQPPPETSLSGSTQAITHSPATIRYQTSRLYRRLNSHSDTGMIQVVISPGAMWPRSFTAEGNHLALAGSLIVYSIQARDASGNALTSPSVFDFSFLLSLAQVNVVRVSAHAPACHPRPISHTERRLRVCSETRTELPLEQLRPV